jgi:hypothetical protein
MIDETYLKTADLAVKDVLYDNLYNMSFLLKDLNGKILDKNVKYILRNLQVLADKSLPAFPISDVVTSHDSLLGKDVMVPELSDYAYDMYSQLGARNSARIKPKQYLYTDEPINEMLEFTKGLPTVATAYMSYAYLEMYSLFIALMEYKPGEVFKYTYEELDIVSDNLKRLSYDISTMGSSENVYRLLNILKLVQRAILFIRISIKTVLR